MYHISCLHWLIICSLSCSLLMLSRYTAAVWMTATFSIGLPQIHCTISEYCFRCGPVTFLEIFLFASDALEVAVWMTATFSTGSKINFSVWACHISGAFLVLFWCSRGRIWLKFGWLQHSPQIYSKINFRVRACHISGVGHWILQVHLHCFSTSCWIIKDCILECKCCKKQTAADVLSISPSSEEICLFAPAFALLL